MLTGRERLGIMDMSRQERSRGASFVLFGDRILTSIAQVVENATALSGVLVSTTGCALAWGRRFVFGGQQ